MSYFKGGGGDINPLNTLLGTPQSDLFQISGMFDIHHSDNDSFDSVHPRELELELHLFSLIYLIDKYGL